MDITKDIHLQWKPDLRMCCCCLSEGCYKNIYDEYIVSDEIEIYNTMLRETFNITLTTDTNSRLICENCIVVLKNATRFKNTVLKTEQLFMEYIAGLKEIKSESIKSEPVQPMNDYDVFNDDASFDDDEILANLKHELGKPANIDDVKPRKRKSSNDKRKKKPKRLKNQEYCEIKDIKPQKDWLQIAERRGNGPILRSNSMKLLANSTICVFQWNKSRYRCFCCKEPFSDMDTLKEHTNNYHTLENIEKRIILQQNRMVKVEVSTLNCKICEITLQNLTNLKDHLKKQHNFEFDIDEDLLVPFKIGAELKCQICSESFTVFRLLNIHMNKHFQKQVCHICGAGFSNLVFLNLHKTRSHRPFSCKLCDLVFNNRIEKKQHDVSVHELKTERKLRFPCPYCDLRFVQENYRVAHLVEKHGMTKPEYNCSVCTKVFITRSLCNNHIKSVHMKEKNHECDICHHLFYTKSDVARHRVTHTGEKKFICSLCSNPFATKDSLRRHMKRTHAVH